MKRPTGAGQFAGGVVTAMVGCLCILRSMTMEVSEYGYTFQDKAGFAIFGLIAISISLVLFATGWIIQAISFLPGKGDATFVSQEAPLELTVGEALPASPSEESPSLVAWLLVGGGIVMALAAVLMLAL